MGSDKQAVACDVGLGLQVSNASPISSTFQQGRGDDVLAQTRIHNIINSGFAFKSPQVPIRGPFSFTKAQWQELERQTVVYNFLSASVPVPPQLLIPISATNPNPSINHPNRLLNFGLPSNGSDQEPWRCRRTDGKKWRCSRDVVPDQKYCERHAHKNRPRSRKHVELHAANLISIPTMSTGKKTHHLGPGSSSKTVEPRSQPFSRNETRMLPYPTLASYDQPRCSFDWFAKGNTTSVDSASQQWQPKEGWFMGSHSSNFCKDVNIFGQQKEIPMSSNGLDLVSDGHSQNDPCGLLLGHKLEFLNDDLTLEHTERLKGFIDAWSTADGCGSISQASHKYSHPRNGTHPNSRLSLSMSGGNAEERLEEHLDIGLMYTEQENSGLKLHQPMMNWMGTESWMGSTPGGPLAEALCLGISSNVKTARTHYQPPLGHGSSSYTANTKLHSSSDESSHTCDK